MSGNVQTLPASSCSCHCSFSLQFASSHAANNASLPLPQQSVHILTKIPLLHRSNISLRHSPLPIHQNRRRHTCHSSRHLRHRLLQRHRIRHLEQVHELPHLHSAPLIDRHSHHRQSLRSQLPRQTNQPWRLLPARPAPCRPVVHQHHLSAMVLHPPGPSIQLRQHQRGHHSPLTRRSNPTRLPRPVVQRPRQQHKGGHPDPIPDPSLRPPTALRRSHGFVHPPA
jgi:hypothetical protein